jgi:hypothetical protein
VVDRNVGLWRIPVLQQQTQGKCMGFSRKELTERKKERTSSSSFGAKNTRTELNCKLPKLDQCAPDVR